MTDHVKVYGVKPRIQYRADGTSVAYEFPFAIFKTSDINVYFGDVLQDTSSYTVSETHHSEGGTVTFETAPVSGTVITIVRNLSIERTSDFQEGSTLRAKVLNDELDYQIACTQQIAENLNRSMVLPPYATDNDLDLTLPTPSAGKAIVWNADGTNLENSTVAVNELESTLNGYKTVAQNAASTATNKANDAIAQAQTATTQAGIAATKAEEANLAVNQLNNMRTNCITEIPQDIKLELNNGTLTLKAGSKVYVPNGVGVFNSITIPNDMNITFQSYSTNSRLFCYNSTNGTLVTVATYQVSSGSSVTPTSTNWLWYDTTNNLIKYTTNSGSNWVEGISLPICICSNIQNTSSSIEQIFNGFGYIGSTIFALPGVKGLIPNGRNTDGTLKNTPWKISSVITRSLSGNSSFSLATEGTVFTTASLKYNELENRNYDINGTLFQRTNCGDIVVSNDKITKLTIKQAFQAVDYSDAVKYSDKETVVGWSMPDYSSLITKSDNTVYTATSNGYIIWQPKIERTYNKYTLTIDGQAVGYGGNEDWANNCFRAVFPIQKGKNYSSNGSSYFAFVPTIGG